MRLLSAGSLAALLLLASAPVFAQTIKAAIPPADDVEAAKAHFAAGSAYYEQADYKDAVKEFNEAYRLSKRSDLLYNIAVCYERLNDYDHAIATLERYLAEKPNAPDRVTIQSRIDNLRKAKAAQPPPPPVASAAKTTPAPAIGAPPPSAPSEPRPRRWWAAGTAVGVSGVAVLAASLGTGLASHSLYEDLVKQCPSTACPPDPALESKQQKGRALQVASDVLVGVGAAAVATGVILLIVQSRRHRTSVVRQAWLQPTAQGVVGRF